MLQHKCIELHRYQMLILPLYFFLRLVKFSEGYIEKSHNIFAKQRQRSYLMKDKFSITFANCKFSQNIIAFFIILIQFNISVLCYLQSWLKPTIIGSVAGGVVLLIVLAIIVRTVRFVLQITTDCTLVYQTIHALYPVSLCRSRKSRS